MIKVQLFCEKECLNVTSTSMEEGKTSNTVQSNWKFFTSNGSDKGFRT